MVLEIGPEELGKVYSKLFEKSIKDKQIQVKQQRKCLDITKEQKENT